MMDCCADCGKTNATWACLNRGILVCHECCGVHRRMGRHVSWVRSLQQTWWSPTLVTMVKTLNAAGANTVWEHTLLDETSSPTGCKPSASDPVNSAKEDLIRRKHEELCYVASSECGDSAQLHGTARTPDLLASLRLLAQGAQPNFYHEEKGSCPLHVAAKTNQILQVELLMVYGADLSSRDSAGRTAEDVARDAGHVPLADRLHSARTHVFDRLVEHVGGLDELSVQVTEASPGRSKLESLSNSQFEKLVADIYDELDRREVAIMWLGKGGGLDPVAFLPPHPALSATRNQGRQKLARLTHQRFTNLILDTLKDAKRRDISMLEVKLGEMLGKSGSVSKLRTDISDDEPLYDSVASDDDYASTNGEPQHQQVEDTLRKSLMASEATIASLQSQVQVLHTQVAGLMQENRQLREQMTRSSSVNEAPRPNLRPISMYEARDRPKNRQPVVAVWPDYNQVNALLHHVTKSIQELLMAMRAMDLVLMAPAAARIRTALANLTALFPQMVPVDSIIAELTECGRQLELECVCSGSCSGAAQEQSIHRIRNIAYDIALKTKQLALLQNPIYNKSN